jgi:hypothetical protein
LKAWNIVPQPTAVRVLQGEFQSLLTLASHYKFDINVVVLEVSEHLNFINFQKIIKRQSRKSTFVEITAFADYC